MSFDVLLMFWMFLLMLYDVCWYLFWCLMMCFDVQNSLTLEMPLTFSRPVADHKPFWSSFDHLASGNPVDFQWHPGPHCPAVLAKQDGKIHFGANGKRSHLTHTPTIPPRNKNPLTPHLPRYIWVCLKIVCVPKFIGSSFSGHSLFKSTNLDAIILRRPDSCARRHRFERQPDISGMICSSAIIALAYGLKVTSQLSSTSNSN